MSGRPRLSTRRKDPVVVVDETGNGLLERLIAFPPFLLFQLLPLKLLFQQFKLDESSDTFGYGGG